MNNMPLITVGIPIHNASHYIERAVLSIVKQTYLNWMCIIVDDGSSDNGIKLIQNMTKLDSRFSILTDSENEGLSYRLNQISTMCTTKYLARMDADDIMHPDRLSTQLKYLQDHPEMDVVGTEAYTIDTTNVVHGYKSAPTGFDTRSAIQGALFIHPSIMGRTEWFKNNPYDVSANRSEDYELWLRTAETSNFDNIREPLMFYREVGLRHATKYSATSDGILLTLEKYLRVAPPELIDAVHKKIKDVKNKKRIFNLASRLGFEKQLIARRSGIMTPEALLEAQSILARAIGKI